MTLTPGNYGNNGYSKIQTDTLLNEKQDTLISGTNIKTINNNSVLGEGNIEIGEGGTIVVNQSYDPTSSYAQSGTAVTQAIATRASTALDNLSSGGQMIIDSANGTISNCILEIPQNIKLTLENNVLTLKAGSTITLTGSIYTTFTTTSDNSRTYSPLSSQRNKRNYIFCGIIGNLTNLYPIDRVKSGSTSSRPETAVNGEVFFDTDEKSFYQYNNGWTTWDVAYPLCMIDVDENGVMSFAKDSKGNDMIFNGAGFIGHHTFTNIQVKELVPYGYNDDGSLKNIEITTNAFLIEEMLAKPFNALFLGNGSIYQRRYLGKFKSLADLPQNSILHDIAYINNDNIIVRYNGTEWIKENKYALFVEYSYDGTTVTDFTIHQPYDGARYLLTDEIKEQVATKQADVTTLTGYDATKTQTLKNVSGVLTWVDDE